MLSFASQSGSITIQDQFTSTEWGIDEVRFADGTILTAAQLFERYFAGAGTAAADTIDGSHLDDAVQGLDGNDLLRGMNGNDRLDGGAGNDRLEGGYGNDVYVYGLGGGNDSIGEWAGFWGSFDVIEVGAGIDAASLVVSRSASASNNLVLTFSGHTGSITIENQLANGQWGVDEVRFADGAILTAVQLLDRYFVSVATSGADVIEGTYMNDAIHGGDGNDVLRGWGGNDILNGGAGDDTLTGGAGNDVFVFADAPGAGNLDWLTDFQPGADRIHLEDSVFVGLAAGALAAGAFHVGAAAADADDRIIYDSTTGGLYFDADGNGSGAAVQFATLSAGLALTASDFFIT